MRLRSAGLLGFQLGKPLILTCWLPILLAPGHPRAMLVLIIGAMVVVIGFLGLGAAFTTDLTNAGTMNFSGPGIGSTLAANNVETVVLGRPYGQNTRRVAAGCAISIRLKDGREMLVPGGLHWRRERVADDVAEWCEQHAVDVITDRPLSRPPRLLVSIKLWRSLHRTSVAP